MSLDTFYLVACQASLVVALLGLLRSGRWRLAWFFLLDLVVVLVSDALRLLWPHTFYTPEFWMAKEALLDALVVSLAIEIGIRTFGPFRNLLPRVRTLGLLLLATAALAGLTASPRQLAPGYDPLFMLFVGHVHPRVMAATLWLMAGILLLATWYRIPLHPFHAAVLGTLGAYLAVNVGLASLEGIHGWALQAYKNAIDRPAFLLVSLAWAWAAWAPAGGRTRAHVATVALLRGRLAC